MESVTRFQTMHEAISFSLYANALRKGLNPFISEIRGASNKFQDFFVQAFKIVLDS